jgi:hypothetical protein
MGVSCFGSSDSYPAAGPAAKPEKLPNPDPSNYEIMASVQSDTYLLILIRYPDCKNYEGRKVLLYKGATVAKLKAQKLIDPHFSDNPKFLSPLARFAPTEEGWEAGMTLMRVLS